MVKRRLPAGRQKVLARRRCCLCGDDRPGVFEAHRALVEGKDGGTYNWANVACLCGSCHNRVHAGLVTFTGRFLCTDGVYYWRVTEDGVERFIPDS